MGGRRWLKNLGILPPCQKERSVQWVITPARNLSVAIKSFLTNFFVLFLSPRLNNSEFFRQKIEKVGCVVRHTTWRQHDDDDNGV